MTDLLTHVFIVYALVRPLSCRIEWLTPQYVTIALAGALVPDFVKIDLLVNDTLIAQQFGIPFSWQPLQLFGGVAISILLGGLLVGTEYRKRAIILLSVGATLHLLADALLLTATGHTAAFLWPLTRWQPPTPGLYLSTDPTPTVFAGLIACIGWAATETGYLVSR